jgi:hypothetical protein
LSEIENLKAFKARAAGDAPVQKQKISVQPDMQQKACQGSSDVEAGAQGGGREAEEEDSEIAKLIATETEVCVCVWGGGGG